MMAYNAQLEVQGRLIELKDSIKYSFQCNDIAQISDRQASYTNSFRIPRTSDVVELFEGLGIAGDTSSAPYRKVSCRLFDNYVPVLEKGWLQVRHTEARYYHVAVYSGVIDFFKAIKNKTTKDIDFSELAHDKTVDAIVNSWENNLPYRYFIADYGVGPKRLFNDGMGDAIDAGALQPAFRISWLWDKIFEKYGFTYSGNIFSSYDFQNRFITYPKNRAQTVETHVAFLRKTNSERYVQWEGSMDQNAWRPFTDGNVNNRYEFYQAEGVDVIQGTPDGWQIRILETGYYRIDFHVNAVMERPGSNPPERAFRFFSKTGNGEFLASALIQPSQVPWEFGDTYQLDAGTIIDFEFDKSVTDIPWVTGLTFNDFSVNVYKIVSGPAPQEALLKINLTDFFKEVLWMFGLTAFPDPYSNNIHFLTMEERLSAGEVVDWSAKYVRRTKEEYVYGYARENYMRHKYVDENDEAYDGVIRVEDENLKESSTLITSHFFAPYRYREVPFVSGITAKQYPFMTVTEEDGETVDEFESGRHFIISGRMLDVTARMGLSGLPGSVQEVGQVMVEDFNNVSYETMVGRYYRSFENILNDSRIHYIDLCLSPPDIAGLRFDRIYYFDQEANYYILNRLQYQEGKFAQGEFVRVKLIRKAGEFSDAFSEDFNI